MSASNTVETLKRIPQSLKDFLNGYTREIEKSVSIHIPSVIPSLCLLYYYQRDYIERADENYEISNDKLSVTCVETHVWKKSVFLHEWIESMSNKIVKWTFYIDINTSGQDYGGLKFVLSSKDEDLPIRFSARTGNPFQTYTFYNNGNYRVCGVFENAPESECKYRRFTTGDTVIYTLDLKAQQLKCKINDYNEFIAATIKVANDIKYKMIMQINDRGDKITLIDYSWSFT